MACSAWGRGAHWMFAVPSRARLARGMCRSRACHARDVCLPRARYARVMDLSRACHESPGHPSLHLCAACAKARAGLQTRRRAKPCRRHHADGGRGSRARWHAARAGTARVGTHDTRPLPGHVLPQKSRSGSYAAAVPGHVLPGFGIFRARPRFGRESQHRRRACAVERPRAAQAAAHAVAAGPAHRSDDARTRAAALGLKKFMTALVARQHSLLSSWP